MARPGWVLAVGLGLGWLADQVLGDSRRGHTCLRQSRAAGLVDLA